MPHINSMHAVLHGGVGFVARWKDAVLVIPALPSHNQAVLALMKDLKPDSDRDVVVHKVHDLVVKQQKLHAVAMLVDTQDGIGAMAFGEMEILHDDSVVLTGSGGPNTSQIRGPELDRLKSVSVRYAASSSAAALAGPSDLRRGFAPGAGVTMSRNNDIVFQAPIPKEAPSFQGTTDPNRRPDIGSSQPSGAMVEGVVCPANHFNDPRSSYCTTCGASIPPGSPLTKSYRPNLGYLVFEDGTPYNLDRSYYIGREPHTNDPNAETIAIPDDQEILSRTHAVVELVEWDVRLRDHNSTNGTYIWNTGQNRWAKLTPSEPVVLTPGTKIMMGRRTFTFDLHPEMSG